MIEAQRVGYGASGRNGGWCSALLPHRSPVMRQPMLDTLAEIARVLEAESIEADFARGGTVVVARNRAQLERLTPEPGGIVLDRDAALSRLQATGTLGGTYTPDCARLHPLKLVRGLARVVEARGARIYEQTTASHLEPGIVRTDRGVVRAQTVLRATEGYTPSLSGMRRDVTPVHSLIVATEPLPDPTWDEIGLRENETFADARHLIVYGQRTADDRLLFGGRGAPYRFGSRLRPEHDRVERVFAALRRDVIEMLPALARHRFTHAWGGTLAIPRDWTPSVGLQRSPAGNLAWAGGYVGDGVSTTNLAARTLTDLILVRDTDLTRLPWVNHRSPRWEPEPLRWLGVNAGLIATRLADREEARTGHPSRIARLVAPLIGG